MGSNYYSDRTLNQFIKTTLCDGDDITYRHFQKGNMKSFRKRLVKDELIEQVVYVACTNILRDIIYEIIGKITTHMKEWGDIVVTGGEAFNNYFDIKDRVVSSDIDTKFIPRFMSSFDKRFFGYLQYCKLYLWQYIGFICSQYNTRVRERIALLRKTHIGKMLGIKPCLGKTCLKRRYTLIKKSPEKNVLIDVELFAIDLNIKYYSPKNKKLIEKNLGGILDLPIMRPYEIGYEVAFSRARGIHTVNPINNNIIYHRDVLIASKQFLIEDLYIMKSLGLRPKKVAKDRKRMVNFAKKVLNIADISSKTSDKEIFEKSLKVIKPTKPVRLVKKGVKLPNITKNISVSKYTKYTSEPSFQGVRKFVGPGIKTKDFFSIEGFEKTSGDMYFDRKQKIWKKSKNPYYIRNRYNFRPTHAKSKPMKLQNTLYGYLPSRNKWVNNNIIKKAATIPLVGLKKSNVSKIVK